MLPTFHEDDHRCHYKDKKLKSAGRFKGAGCTIFLFYFMTAADPASETLYFNKRCWKGENALRRRMHSVVKRQR